MPIKKAEQLHRGFIDAIRNQLDIDAVDDIDVIRGAALALFTKELEGKLRNLQDGETLQLTFRIDIVTADGAIRGGSGSDRNMPEYIAWRNAVYQRDEYACQECGSTDGLNAHHIKTWYAHPDLRFEVSNGVTLCGDCHAKKHPHLRFVKHGPANKTDA